MKIIKLFIFLVLIVAGINLRAQQPVAPSSQKKLILVDVAHGQKFWNDPSSMKKNDPKQVERVRYMASEMNKIATSLDATIAYQKNKIGTGCLANCRLLFIHVPSSKFSAAEVKIINQYLQGGGSLFLAMDEDYWSTLKQTKVNELIKSYGIQYGTQSPDTLSGGYTVAGTITDKSLKISYHGGRIIQGGTPFCFNNQTREYPFGVYLPLENGGKLIVMGDGMVSLFMTNWKGVKDYQCSEFIHDVFKWLLN